MKYNISLCILVFIAIGSFGQEKPVYWLGFTDKNNNEYSIDAPDEFLSQRALDRRSKQGINIDSTDLPVSKLYVDSIENTGFELRYTSKWLNGAAVMTNDSAMIDTITNIEFVSDIEFIRAKDTAAGSLKNDDLYDYGYGYNQVEMLNGHMLHNQGYSGEGMLIAVLDAGFFYMPAISAFNNIYDQNRIMATRDYVSLDNNVYGYHTHGKSVMSILAGESEGQLVGTAPHSDFILIRTEDDGTEQRIEEYNWIAGAEFADSLGADVFNVSLGYKTFDRPEWEYDNFDIDGETAPISKAAGMAAQKGILVVVAAGNNGDDPDPKIGVPADADSILTAGSVDSLRNYSDFSSVGYTADGRVKPDVVAQGQQTYYINNSDSIDAGNGTSFATPIISGLAACLWQAHPEKSNMQIINAIRKSASLYDNPNDSLGYGIPDFAAANLMLNNIQFSGFGNEQLVSLYPNPVNNQLNVDFYSIDTQSIIIRVFDISGKLMLKDTKSVRRTSYNTHVLHEVALLPKGLYVLQMVTDNDVYSRKFIKQ
ncbi:MAG: S8/S53 family peptidase [Bacteroidota bacterium]